MYSNVYNKFLVAKWFGIFQEKSAVRQQCYTALFAAICINTGIRIYP